MSIIRIATGLSILQTVAPTAPSSANDAAKSKKPVAVEDTLANLKTNLAGLKKNIANVSTINITDSGHLSFSGEELTKYAGVIAKISGKRSLDATAVDTTTLAGILKNANVRAMDVTDTTANIGANWGSLTSNNSRIRSITLTDSANMAITYSGFLAATGNGGVLSKLSGPNQLVGKLDVSEINRGSGVSGVSLAQFNTVNASGKLHSAVVADTLSKVVAERTSLNTNVASAKISKVNLLAKEAGVSIKSADYSNLLSQTNLMGAMGSSALRNAFSVTDASFAASAPGTGALAKDGNVKSIAVVDIIRNLPVATGLSSKVNRVDLSGTRADYEATGALDKMAALEGKLGKVSLTDGNTVTIAATAIRFKNVTNALAKTVGSDGNAVGAEVTGANLADVSGLLANKQVNRAAISDTAENMLNFSADTFAILSHSANVTLTLEDNATNVSRYHNELKAAVKLFNSCDLQLSVQDTAQNLTDNLANLDDVATSISRIYDNTRIKIKQVDATGAADITSLIKVDYSSYAARRDVLQYVKDATSGMAQEHVEIDTNAIDSATSINNAKLISENLRVRKYLTDLQYQFSPGPPPGGTLATVPTFTAGAGIVQNPNLNTAENRLRYNGWTNYSDVKQIDIALKGDIATKATEYGSISRDKDFLDLANGGNLKSGTTISVLA